MQMKKVMAYHWSKKILNKSKMSQDTISKNKQHLITIMFPQNKWMIKMREELHFLNNSDV